MILLDTHTWIWTVEGDAGRLGRQSRRLIARAESQGAVLVSPVSVFEVTALQAAGRLQLALSVERWVRRALDASVVKIAELSVDVAVDAGSIPRTALADPLDRLLVATARQLNATFLTSDAHILSYAASTGNVRARNSSR